MIWVVQYRVVSLIVAPGREPGLGTLLGSCSVLAFSSVWEAESTLTHLARLANKVRGNVDEDLVRGWDSIPVPPLWLCPVKALANGMPVQMLGRCRVARWGKATPHPPGLIF